MGIHPLVQVILGAGLGYAVGRYIKYRTTESDDEGLGIMENRTYGSSSRRTKRSAATSRCVVSWVARHGFGEAKQVARSHRDEILESARRATARRSRTRDRRGKKSYR